MPELAANGPPIPTHLINGPDSRRTVFFQGVGVSTASESGFPSFVDLRGNVYEANHIQPDTVGHEALDHEERRSGRWWPNSDGTLGLLTRPERSRIRQHRIGSDSALCGMIRGRRFPAK